MSEDERRRLTGATRLTTTEVRVGQIRVRNKLVTSGAPTEPYFLGFYYFITEALKHAPPDVAVNFIFDNRDESGEVRAKESVGEIIQYSTFPEIRDRIGLVSFGSSEKHESLQAADLYAYVWNRTLHKRMTEPLRHALDRLTKKRPGIGIAEADFYKMLIGKLDLDEAVAVLRTLFPKDA